MHDGFDGCYRLGYQGSLIPLPDTGDLTVKTADSSVVTQSAAGGVRTLHLASRERRTWEVTIPYTRPEFIAPLHELVMNPMVPPPYLWVTPWASAVNLLTPEQSLMVGASGAMVGRWPLAEGGFTPSALQPFLANTYILMGTAPVEPDRPVTVTVRASTATGVLALVKATFLDRNGASLADYTVTGDESPQALVPVSVSVAAQDIPAGAVQVQVQARGAVIARPQVTWTSSVVPWGVGDGVAQVDVVLGDRPVRMAVADNPYFHRADFSFTVRELG